MPTTVYLITGANRGIGRGLLASLIQRPDTIVVAGVRDPSHATSKEISSLPTASGSKVIVVKIDATSDADTSEAVKTLQSTYNINHIDVVIANAGISKYYGPVAVTPVAELREHFEVNTAAPLLLFQASLPLLEKSPNPKFVAVSTAGASIGDMGDFPIPFGAYGASKASLNYLTRKIHFENEKLIAFPLSPGWVQTDMGNAGAHASGMSEAPVTLKESVDGILDKIDNATREETSGTFQSFDDKKFNW